MTERFRTEKPPHDCTLDVASGCPACAWEQEASETAAVVKLIDDSLQFAPKPCRAAMLAARRLLTAT